MKKYYACVLLILFMAAFQMPVSDPTYEAEIKKWHAARIASLQSETGWLNLAGLFWLKEGSNSFGSDSTNAIVFPKGAPFLGAFILENGQVQVNALPNAAVFQDGKSVESTTIFTSPGQAPVVLSHQSLRWFVIQRGDRYGIRLRDLEHPALQAFQGVEMFPIDKSWRVEATLETALTEKKIPITDVLGMTSLQVSPGTLVFQLQGQTFRLDAVKDGDELFILFGDETNGETTYSSGRFLYAAQPDANGKTILDFNKAYNPPCAFTPYATCPLPPKQNQLPIAITAGEKNFGDH